MDGTMDGMMEETKVDIVENAGAGEEEKAEKGKKMAETLQKVKTFLYENKDTLILCGQLTLVAIVCVVGIKNDLEADYCCKKKRKKSKRK